MTRVIKSEVEHLMSVIVNEFNVPKSFALQLSLSKVKGGKKRTRYDLKLHFRGKAVAVKEGLSIRDMYLELFYMLENGGYTDTLLKSYISALRKASL